jgi:hypothetical protein
MFVLLQRTDTLPEMRVLVDTGHIAAAAPVGGGVRTRLYLTIGEAWEISLPFARAIAMLRDGQPPPPTDPAEEETAP